VAEQVRRSFKGAKIIGGVTKGPRGVEIL
jgi:hypothetical protein